MAKNLLTWVIFQYICNFEFGTGSLSLPEINIIGAKTQRPSLAYLYNNREKGRLHLISGDHFDKMRAQGCSFDTKIRIKNRRSPVGSEKPAEGWAVERSGKGLGKGLWCPPASSGPNSTPTEEQIILCFPKSSPFLLTSLSGTALSQQKQVILLFTQSTAISFYRLQNVLSISVDENHCNQFILDFMQNCKHKCYILFFKRL